MSGRRRGCAGDSSGSEGEGDGGADERSEAPHTPQSGEAGYAHASTHDPVSASMSTILECGP
ncbi:hypothetical protein GCM10009617_35850 [Leifsonia poae]